MRQIVSFALISALAVAAKDGVWYGHTAETTVTTTTKMFGKDSTEREAGTVDEAFEMALRFAGDSIFIWIPQDSITAIYGGVRADLAANTPPEYLAKKMWDNLSDEINKDPTEYNLQFSWKNTRMTVGFEITDDSELGFRVKMSGDMSITAPGMTMEASMCVDNYSRYILKSYKKKLPLSTWPSEIRYLTFKELSDYSYSAIAEGVIGVTNE